MSPQTPASSARVVVSDNPGGVALLRTVIPTAIISIYLFLRMFYLSEGGSVQVADFFIIAFIPFFVGLSSIKAIYAVNRPIIWMLLLFVVINLIWFFITADPTVGINVAYYFYNFLLFTFVFAVREGNRVAFDRYIPLVIIAATAVQIGAILLGSSGEYRTVGTFSNPNQLAYWAICLVTCQMIIARDRPVVTTVSVLLLGICLALSLSRGGLMGFGAVVAIYALQRFKNIHLRIFSGLFAAILVTLFVGSDALSDLRDRYDLASKLEERSEQRSLSDEWENRNYSRLSNNPQYIPFGAGEGAFERFEGERYKDGHYVGIEIHSTYATLLFSYGVLGLVLFIAMLLRFARVSIVDTIYLVGTLSYGLSHNGLRFALFWFVLAVLASVARQRLQVRAAAARVVRAAAIS